MASWFVQPFYAQIANGSMAKPAIRMNTWLKYNFPPVVFVLINIVIIFIVAIFIAIICLAIHINEYDFSRMKKSVHL